MRSTEHGFTFDSDNPDDLVEKLNQCLEDPDLIGRQSEAAIDYTHTELAWEQTVEKDVCRKIGFSVIVTILQSRLRRSCVQGLV